jgi:hypothetical protein
MTFHNNFNTCFFLRLNDPGTAEFLSRSIGKREIIKRMEGRQLSPKDIGDRKAITDQGKIEKLMLPSESMHIQDFWAIVKLSSFGVSEVDIPKKSNDSRTPHFLEWFAFQGKWQPGRGVQGVYPRLVDTDDVSISADKLRLSG